MIIYEDREEYLKYNKDEDGRIICIDCGMRYEDFADLTIDDDLWEKIAPYKNSDGGGILCPNCILKRLSELNYNRNAYFKLNIGK